MSKKPNPPFSPQGQLNQPLINWLEKAENIANFGVSDFDIKTGQSKWSQGLYRLTGFDPNDPPPSLDAFISWIFAEDHASVKQVFQQVIKDKGPGFIAFRHQETGGPIRYFEGTLEPEKDDKGTVVRIFGTIQEITMQKTIEENLLTNRLQFDQILDNLMEGCQILSHDWRYIYLNKTAARYGRNPVEALIGKRVIEVYPGFEQTPLYDLLNECMTRNIRKSAEIEFIYPNGDKAWFDFRIQPVSEGLFVLSNNITERKQTETLIHESEMRYRGLFDNMSEGFALCRMVFKNGKPEDFLYLDVNDKFSKLTGLKDVRGKLVSEVIPGIKDLDPELFIIYGRVVKTGIPEKFEIFVEALNLWFSISVYTPEKDHFVAIFDVINERKLAEFTLRFERDRFNKIASTVPGVIMSMRKNPEGLFSIPYASPKIADLFGIPKKEL